MEQQAIEQQQAMQQAADLEVGAMGADCLPAAPINDEDLPDRPTVDEVGRWLGKSRNTIYNWVRDGIIPCKRAGRSYIFDKAALLKWARPEEAA